MSRPHRQKTEKLARKKSWRSGGSTWPKRIKWVFGGLVTVVLFTSLWLWWSLPDVSSLAKDNPKTTAFIELRRNEASSGGASLKLRWSWRPIGRISPYLQHAVVAAEDAKFWKHNGVDWDAVEDAAEEAWETKSMKRGGSTITQQLAKNLYLSPSRNPLRKLREFFIARRLENELDKKRILELYLNVAEWGDGTFGAEAAARRWYGVNANALSPSQAARLAVALPNPFLRHPKKRSRSLDRKARRLVRSMRRARLLSEQEYQLALGELGGSSAEDR